jgi:retron-type reverse transcriptase
VQYEATVPAVRDRIVQAAARIVVEPIFEADMLECSFGFRPRRSAHDALQVLVDEAWGGRRWVLESDVADCFEAIPHSQLMSAIEERIVDRQILKLLRAMLRAGVMEDRAVKRSDAGTPQGSLCSAEHNPPYAQYRVMRSSAWNRPWLLGLACRHSA